jgi:lysophospholipid acyltransferase (LPLAT)-like uncharacterized protein
VSASRHPWWVAPASYLGSLVLRALGATWRIERQDAPEYTAAFARGERFLYAFWHCTLLPLTFARRGEGIAVLVSQHRDGELMLRVIRHLGYVGARGSSTRGGETGVREMLARAAERRSLAITPDGPRGPAEQVKDGTVYLAGRTQLRVVPIAMSARPAWALRSWDRFRIPQLFARVRICHGAPLALEAQGPGGPERARIELQQSLAALTHDARLAMREVV